MSSRSARPDASYHASPEQLEAGNRIACHTPLGINLMLRRRVKHFSRVTVNTTDFMEANLGVYEEADMIEAGAGSERTRTVAESKLPVYRRVPA
ncbi:hypothetical protein OH540_07630 [Streptomyces sp. BPPL-273]|uniref:hypothetical protein n=1 Tax=Streptomyces TaxID=1883 RepID=UPI0024AE955F|nr:hypothetical protein [Streptomyces sp. BPPL-273]WHM29902.1 hypothetical protein OH540_07630 [Streptomyces sp. BPPL-273]